MKEGGPRDYYCFPQDVMFSVLIHGIKVPRRKGEKRTRAITTEKKGEKSGSNGTQEH